MKRIIAILGLAAFLFIGLIFTSLKAQSEFTDFKKGESSNGIVVLELFTSQGCSSCPPADELLKKIKQSNRENVYTISYHVDYWNYIGWEDPFSKAGFTTKQTAYNKKLLNKSNYTPQLVINGKEHFVGSNARKLYQNLQLYGSVMAENQIVINSVEREPRRISLEYKIEGSIGDKNLRAVLLIDERITEIKRGENRNRTLVNNDIAVAETKRPIDKKDGSIQILIPDLVHPADKLSIVIVVENSKSDIVGATNTEIN